MRAGRCGEQGAWSREQETEPILTAPRSPLPSLPHLKRVVERVLRVGRVALGADAFPFLVTKLRKSHVAFDLGVHPREKHLLGMRDCVSVNLAATDYEDVNLAVGFVRILHGNTKRLL